jgi:hypothetical protein
MNASEKIEWNKQFDEIAREFGVRVDYDRDSDVRRDVMIGATANLLVAILIELRKMNEGDKK